MSEKSIKSQSQARFPNDNYRKNYDNIFREAKSCLSCDQVGSVKSTEYPCCACIDEWESNGKLKYFKKGD